MATLRNDSRDCGRPAPPRPVGGRSTPERGVRPRAEAPLIDLLGELRSLHALHIRGLIGDAEYEQRRGEVLLRI